MAPSITDGAPGLSREIGWGHAVTPKLADVARDHPLQRTLRVAGQLRPPINDAEASMLAERQRSLDKLVAYLWARLGPKAANVPDVLPAQWDTMIMTFATLLSNARVLGLRGPLSDAAYAAHAQQITDGFSNLMAMPCACVSVCLCRHVSDVIHISVYE